MLKYENKMKPGKGVYRMCRVARVKFDDKGLVRTVWINIRKRDSREKGLPNKFDPEKDLVEMEMGVQRLVVICPATDVPQLTLQLKDEVSVKKPEEQAEFLKDMIVKEGLK